MKKQPKQTISDEKPKDLLAFNYFMILHWERVKQPSRVCPHSYGNPAYHNHFTYFILKYIHDIQKYSCLPTFEDTIPLTKLGHEPSTSVPSFFPYASIGVPCRHTLAATAQGRADPGEQLKSTRKHCRSLKAKGNRSGGLNPDFPSSSKWKQMIIEHQSPLSHL